MALYRGNNGTQLQNIHIWIDVRKHCRLHVQLCLSMSCEVRCENLDRLTSKSRMVIRLSSWHYIEGITAHSCRTYISKIDVRKHCRLHVQLCLSMSCEVRFENLDRLTSKSRMVIRLSSWHYIEGITAHSCRTYISGLMSGNTAGYMYNCVCQCHVKSGVKIWTVLQVSLEWS